jgi:hypothetical protein
MTQHQEALLRPGCLRPLDEKVNGVQADAHAGLETLLEKMTAEEAWAAYNETYGYVIPTPELVELLRAYSPLVDYGCGNGYLAYVLARAGANVLAIDREPPEKTAPNKYFRTKRMWTKVFEGESEALELCAGRTLLIAWPPPEPSDMASRALEAYRGKFAIIIEDDRVCSDAHEVLSRDYKRIGGMGLPVLTPAALMWSAGAVRVYQRMSE